MTTPKPPETSAMDTKFYWFAELIGSPPKYVRNYGGQDSTNPPNFGWCFTSDPHLADKMTQMHATAVAEKFQRAGINVEAREHGFMYVKPVETPDAP